MEWVRSVYRGDRYKFVARLEAAGIGRFGKVKGQRLPHAV